MSEEKVNHPKHYNANPSGVECITVVEHMPFNLGNAIKYLWRAGEKGAFEEDLRKAIWYIEREIKRRAINSYVHTRLHDWEIEISRPSRCIYCQTLQTSANFNDMCPARPS